MKLKFGIRQVRYACILIALTFPAVSIAVEPDFYLVPADCEMMIGP